VQYFNGVNENRSKLGISSLIEVCPLCRYPIQSGFSDPGRVLDLLEEYVRFLKHGKYPLDLFINTVISSAIPEDETARLQSRINKFAKGARAELRPLSTADGIIKDTDTAREKCSDLFCKVFGVEKVHFDIPEPIDYREERDIVCVVVDRDAETRESSKCTDFFARCRNDGFEPYMTNPCFEMWLLLHFDEIFDDDKDVLRLNEKTDGIRYTEKRLDEILRSYPANTGYSKDALDFNSFMHRVDNAVKNEKMFCHDLKCIKTEVGSNIGSLIEKIRQRD